MPTSVDSSRYDCLIYLYIYIYRYKFVLHRICPEEWEQTITPGQKPSGNGPYRKGNYIIAGVQATNSRSLGYGYLQHAFSRTSATALRGLPQLKPQYVTA
jgi:hypothetical protein